jgi:membrane-associated protease RseP (regulator of RpoE activity)
MNSHRHHAFNLAHLVCLLPLLFLFLIVALGVRLNPLVVPVVMILCCLAMFYLMAGACGPGHHQPVRPPVREVEPAPASPPSGVEDVFRVRGSRQTDDGLVLLHGELLRPPQEVFQALQKRLAGTGWTALLQEGPDREPLLIFVPAADERPAAAPQFPWLNLVLLALTFLTTTAAGARHAGVDLWREPGRFADGLPYSVALLLILGAHELGHYFAARSHRISVSLPYFIPVPFGLGTFGAFIRMRSTPADRRALFDVAVAGPLAGLALALPALGFGLQHSAVVAPDGKTHAGMDAGSSLLFALVARLALGDGLSGGHQIQLHPLAFAGWLGLLITALNLLLIGQLDGGHIADAMLGRVRGAAVGAVALFALFVLGLFVWSGLLTWALIVYFIAGGKGLPPLNDITRMGVGRLAVGAIAFVLLFLILAPVPHRLYDALGIHCPYL